MAALNEPDAVYSVLKRTVFLRNLPYGTTVQEVNLVVVVFGPIESIRMGAHGISSEVVYMYPWHARYCVGRYRQQDHLLIMQGKVISVSLAREKGFRILFNLWNYHKNKAQAKFTAIVDNLSPATTSASLATFFTDFGCNVREPPVIQGRDNGSMYAFVTFVTQMDRNHALLANGFLHLERAIVVNRSHGPRDFRIGVEDL